jgi:hypothetical protein
MDQDFQSRENLCVIVKGEKIVSVQALDAIDETLFKKAKKVNLIRTIPAIPDSRPPMTKPWQELPSLPKKKATNWQSMPLATWPIQKP